MAQPTVEPQPSWFAVTTRSRHEKVAATTCHSQGITCFLPMIEEVRHWSDRKQRIASPVFPGYLFVCIERTPEAQVRVLRVPGVADFVKNRQGPMAVAEYELENVRKVLSRGMPVVAHPSLTAGDYVRVIRGPLAGVEGTFVRTGGRSRILISVQLIQQAVAVEVEEADVESLLDADLRVCG
jgi:transcription termination/antitermination protein NusG